MGLRGSCAKVCVAASLAAVLLGVGWPNATLASDRRPNFVIILIDDLGVTDIGPYGESFADTPTLDQFAADGLRFSDGYAAAPVCSPTRAALLSGAYGPRTDVTRVIIPSYADASEANTNTPIIPPPAAMNYPSDMPSIAAVLGRAGYHSGLVGKWHLGWSVEPADLGFDEAHEWGNLAYGKWYAPWFVGGLLRILPNTLEQALGWGAYNPAALTDDAVAFLERNAERPFFLYLSHYTVHDPVQARDETLEKYLRRADERGAHGENPHFAAMLEEMDQSIGGVLAALDRLGLARDTLVLITSDNGGLVTRPQTRMITLVSKRPWPHTPSTDLTPFRAGKGTLYEGGIRVPYLVRWPGVIPADANSSEVITSVDILPTFAELAGVPPGELPASVDGVSLADVLRDPDHSLRRSSIFWHYPYYPEDYPGYTPSAAVRSGSHKLIHFYEDGRNELYDLSADPGERSDLSDQEPELTERLWRNLDEWQSRVGARIPRLRER